MSWAYLFAAIVFEVAGTMSMKLSEGFTKLVPSVLIFVFYAVAFTLVTLAIRKIEISVAYTVWSGVGVALIALIGIFYFGEQITALKIASILLVITGVIGLRING
jgi:small multidrug resistance pump